MIDFSKYDFLRKYLSNEVIENMLDMYIKCYFYGPFKGQLSEEFLILLNEKLIRNEIE
jgi:hypothetical protein